MRLRSFALLLIFAALYLLLERMGAALMSGGMIVRTTITLLAALGGGALLLRVAERRPVAALGIGAEAARPRDMLAAFALPVAALGLVATVLIAIGSLRYAPQAGSPAAWLAGSLQLLLLLAIPAAAEEALFRGYPFQKLVEIVGPSAAAVLASALFAFMHRHNPSIDALAMLNIFLAGLMLSGAFLWTRSLWFATAVHLSWNWMSAGPLDLPVSGLELYDAPLYDPVLRGPRWLDGGAFGPEGGLAGTVALLLLSAALWFFVRKRVHERDQ